MTALDLQMKTLRDAAVNGIMQMAIRMKEEATDVKATVGDIEDWLDRIKQLAEEVRANETILLCTINNVKKLKEMSVKHYNVTDTLCVSISLRTACQM